MVPPNCVNWKLESPPVQFDIMAADDPVEFSPNESPSAEQLFSTPVMDAAFAWDAGDPKQYSFPTQLSNDPESAARFLPNELSPAEHEMKLPESVADGHPPNELSPAEHLSNVPLRTADVPAKPMP